MRNIPEKSESKAKWERKLGFTFPFFVKAMLKPIVDFVYYVDWSGRRETPQKCYRISFVRCLFKDVGSMSCGKSRTRETKQVLKRQGGSRTARGKRVPGAEINR